MRVLLRLGHAQLGAACIRDDLTQNIRERDRLKDRLQQRVQVLAVLRHARGGGEMADARAWESGECRIEKGSQDFAHPVGAKVEAEQTVSVAHAAVAADHGRQHELVGDIAGIRIRDRRLRIGKAWPLRIDDRMVSLGNAVPAIVTIHRIVPAADRYYGNPVRQHRSQALNIVAGRLRGRVASVGEYVEDGRHASRAQRLCESRSMILVGVHTTRRYQAHEMAGAPRPSQALDQAEERRRPHHLTGIDGLVDARQILQHDASGADIQVSDLRVPHLAFRQAHIPARRVQQSVWAVRPQLAKGGGTSEADSIVGRGFSPTPAVQYYQHDGTVFLNVDLHYADP